MKRSIVRQCAYLAAAAIFLTTWATFTFLYYTQKNIYEEKLVADGVENVQKVTRFLLGFFYSQGNWVHLRQHQHHLESSPNILYSYIVDDQGLIDFGIGGLDSDDVGLRRQSWEPELIDADNEISTVRFKANDRLVKRFPERVRIGDEMVLIAGPFVCPEYQRSCASIRVAMTFEGVTMTLAHLRRSLVASGAFIIIIASFLVFWLVKRSLRPIQDASAALNRLANDGPGTDQPLHYPSQDETLELASFRNSLTRYVDATRRTHVLEQELVVSRKLSDLAAQVAHDIRSPLAALESVVSDLNQLPEKSRVIVRGSILRIRDIANKLIHKQDKSQDQNGGAVPQLIAGLVERIYIEKSTQYRFQKGLNLNFKLLERHYGLFAIVDTNEFLRVVSNIVDNAVQATEGVGEVEISLQSSNDQVVIVVSDHGCGIAPENLEAVFDKGVSFNKAGGTGLGLYSARKQVRYWGGEVELASEFGKGTAVTIHLPIASPPKWFTSAVIVPDGATVVVLDDDQFIHDVWKERFASYREELIVKHFTSAKDLFSWLSSQMGDSAFVFLIDYELQNDDVNGLDVIERCKAFGKAILVTSRYIESSMQKLCEKRNVALLPKEAAHLVPVKVWGQAPIDLVLVDDDPWIREAWSMGAEQAGLSLCSLSSGKELVEVMAFLDRKVFFFVDVFLKDTDGRDIVRMLLDAGFQEVYFATGAKLDGVHERFPGLRGVVGKDFPLNIMMGSE